MISRELVVTWPASIKCSDRNNWDELMAKSLPVRLFTKTKEPVGEKLVFLLACLRGTVTSQSNRQPYYPQWDMSLYENQLSYCSKGISPKGYNLNFHFLNLPNTNKVVCHDLWMPGSQWGSVRRWLPRQSVWPQEESLHERAFAFPLQVCSCRTV